MKTNIENNTSLEKGSINKKLTALETKSKDNLDFAQNSSLLGKIIKNYGESEEYQETKTILIAGIEQELNIKNNIS